MASQAYSVAAKDSFAGVIYPSSGIACGMLMRHVLAMPHSAGSIREADVDSIHSLDYRTVQRHLPPGGHLNCGRE